MHKLIKDLLLKSLTSVDFNPVRSTTTLHSLQGSWASMQK